ncbi:AraC family transcriptional regulator (plasmid) [Rhizobium sp. 32-5/1]|uniref:AraC family transcriptional regulator n=1 Tax=Rhizobium sp. 32-5/1 TaxID=3019602 RepID=UPI00240D3441|nr:AraC family transcriptional regulator [Rhizobium sp. 32-5/1]WEZ85281.1 AraC family transcriptional regulator [Rhizobium sp. 32-5/1]
MRKSTPRRETPVAFILAILQAYENRSIDPVVALSQAGFRREDLREPSDRVAVEPFEALSTYAMRELDDEGLGWFSRRLRWGTYGMLLRASLPSPSLDIALRRWCRHHNLLTEDIRLEMRIHGSQAVVRIHEMVDLGDLREFCLVSLLRNLHGIACWLADSRIVLDKARFPFSRPSYADAYRRMFQGTIVFQAAEASITFDAAYLQLPVVREDNALRQILQNPIRLMARLYRQDRLLSRKIIELLSAKSDGLDPDAEAIAENLGVSIRSLQRHLREEGTSLQVLKSRVRLSKAADLLRRGDLPIKRIAYLTGYRDESSFSRAFRRWTGQSPAEFRCGALPLHQSLAFDATHSEHRD